MEPLVQLSTDLNRLLVPELSGSVAWCRSCISQVQVTLETTGANASVSHAADCPLPRDSGTWPVYFQVGNAQSEVRASRVPIPVGPDRVAYTAARVQ